MFMDLNKMPVHQSGMMARIPLTGKALLEKKKKIIHFAAALLIQIEIMNTISISHMLTQLISYQRTTGRTSANVFSMNNILR